LWRNEVFTDTPITHHNDPAWFCARASWRAFRHAYGSFNKSVRVVAITNFAFLAKIFALFVFLRKSRNEVRENLRFLVDAALTDGTDGRFQSLPRTGLPRSATAAAGVFIPLQVIDYGSQSRGYSSAPLQLK
jgi:hypothetical protein